MDASGGGAVGPESATPEPLGGGAKRARAGVVDDRFEVHDVLGRGAMGTVYKARDRASRRWLALKVLQRAEDAQQVARFRREGEIAASLDHPGVVRVHSAGEAEGRPYLAYELVEEGRSLGEALAGAPLRSGVEWIRDAAAAIGHAHAAGVVHRDVKPDNVLVDARGRVRVTDFGIATARDRARLTQTGAALGTPSYMAPEAFERDGARTPGPATDVWSLGVMLYETLCDRLPFEGRTVFELAARVASGDFEPPRRVNPAVGADLAAVCGRALRVDPAERYPDAGALAADLDAWLEGRGVSARPLPLEWLGLGRRGRAALLLGLGLTAALLLAGVAWHRSRRASGEPAARRAPPDGDARASAEPAALGAPAWYRALSPEARPPWPLPHGLRCADAAGEYENERDGSRLVWVPPGSFRMGSEHGNPDERPVHRVTLTRGYFLGVHEVTWAQYRRFCAESGRPLPEGPAHGFLELPKGDRFPVTNVRWLDARAYCAWAGLRLPTEAEWEHAARGGEGRRYPWGDETPTPSHGNVLNGTGLDTPFLETNPAEAIPGAEDPYAYTAPVGSYPLDRSAFGCLDMAGNVLEWVQDRYAERYPEGDVTDPKGPAVGDHRVRRTASWNSPEKHMRCADRDAKPESLGDMETGFRVARSLERGS